MTEIYADIAPEIKVAAETAWKIAKAQKTPLEAAEFLHRVMEYYEKTLTEYEVEFLQFYFQLQMEMMRNE